MKDSARQELDELTPTGHFICRKINKPKLRGMTAPFHGDAGGRSTILISCGDAMEQNARLARTTTIHCHLFQQLELETPRLKFFI